MPPYAALNTDSCLIKALDYIVGQSSQRLGLLIKILSRLGGFAGEVLGLSTRGVESEQR